MEHFIQVLQRVKRNRHCITRFDSYQNEDMIDENMAKKFE